MTDTDFLPQRIRESRARRQRWGRYAWALTLLVAALVAWGLAGQSRIRQARAELAMLQDRTVSLQKQRELKSGLKTQLADLLIKERISKELGSRVNTLDLAYELERLLPTSMFLVSLNLDTIECDVPRPARPSASARATAAPPTAAPQNRVRLTLTGVAPDDVTVANFIGQLSASPLFEDVNMGYTRNTVFEGRQARTFQASCYVAQ